jgi:peptidoglycan/xylan/chitin deacetylase (PgdA/CDA1 family)
VRELARTFVRRFRLSGRRTAHVAAAGAAGSVALVLAIVVGAALTGSGIGDIQAGNRSASPDGSRIAYAMPSRATPTAVPRPTEVEDAPAAASPLPSAGPNADPSCDPLVDPDCGPTPPSPMPSIETGAGPDFVLHVPILEYHRIKTAAGETGSRRYLIVPPDAFAAQMDAMAQAGWHTITMGQLGDDLRMEVQPAPKSFVVTFDDGYEDGYTSAFPILRSHGFVATYFVVAGQIGRADHLTVSELQALLAAGNEIGNHTISHVNLMLKTPDQLRTEIYGASALIARDIGVWPQSFAYPLGLTDAQVAAAVAATPGLQIAVIEGGTEAETWPNRLQIPRIRVGPGTYPQDLVDKAIRYAG